MNDMLNDERYVRVTDLQFGESESYTDFEELALRSGDPDWYTELRRQVVTLSWHEWLEHQRNIDRCDLVFYTSIHVLSSYSDCDVDITNELVQTVVETCVTMLGDLKCQWVMRSGHDWKDQLETNRERWNLQHRS